MKDLTKAYLDAKYEQYPNTISRNPYMGKEELYYAYEAGLSEASYIINKFNSLEEKLDKLLAHFNIN